KVTACLTTLDTLITAETQKLETLKTHKKGLMQQLFPSAQELDQQDETGLKALENTIDNRPT
ncbi:MAG TPA: hypothetical protein PKZ19_15760, partial [Zoogloea sp.]|nr:hypothetical protein [Zoogloea sp.]